MPELPEVETVVRGLAKTISGGRILDVDLRRKDLRTPFPKDFAGRIRNARITSVSRRAKYLLFALDNEYTILAHLGMSGRFSVIPKAPKAFEKHDHVVFTLDDGRLIIYNDARRFGVMDVVKTKNAAKHPLLAHLGPEPLSEEFSAAYLKSRLLKRKGALKPAIMDQELVVGVGNIYASEALFLAGIHPQTPSHQAAAKSTEIVESIRKVLQSAIVSGGSSLKDFVHISGEAGYFQHHFNVYDRCGEPCFSCKNLLMNIRQAGRSTFYCGTCQR
jgi:formamidopyrimidine-DNA glycosylase